MKKIFYLNTCDTCTRILTAHDFSDFEKQEIKSEPITAQQIDKLKELAGSYEALFSRRAKLYREMGLHEENLSEADYKHYLLEHYTFLKRPVMVNEKEVLVGSTAKAKQKIDSWFS